MKINAKLVGTILLIILDQITKHIASNLVRESYILKPIGFGIKYITYREFHLWRFLSIDDKFGIIFIIVTAFVLFILYLVHNFLIFKVYNKKTLINTAFTLISGGLISNLGDRLVLGSARDFLVVPYCGITNIADIFHYTGCFIFLYVILENLNIGKGEIQLFLKKEKEKLLSMSKKGRFSD